MTLQDFPLKHFNMLSLTYLFLSALINLLSFSSSFFKSVSLSVLGEDLAVYCSNEMIQLDFSVCLQVEGSEGKRSTMSEGRFSVKRTFW